MLRLTGRKAQRGGRVGETLRTRKVFLVDIDANSENDDPFGGLDQNARDFMIIQQNIVWPFDLWAEAGSQCQGIRDCECRDQAQLANFGRGLWAVDIGKQGAVTDTALPLSPALPAPSCLGIA